MRMHEYTEDTVRDLIENVEGWLTFREGALLYQLARNCKGKGVIVEIGSWKGRSTICLGTGSKDGKQQQVYAIDPHTGSAEHQSGQPVWTFDCFQENIRRAGLVDVISPLLATSEEAGRDFDKPVELLFIDGAHEYEAIKKDVELWLPKLVDGGIIALHDTTTWSGPHRVVKEYFKDTGLFPEVGRVESITWGRKNKAVFNLFRKLERRHFFNRLDRVSREYIQD